VPLTQLANLKMWFEGELAYQSAGGAAAVANGDPVGQWWDQSGNGNHAVQTIAGSKPLLRTGVNGIGGYPALEFDNIDDFLVPPFTSISGAYTLYVVINTNAGDATSGIVYDTEVGRLVFYARNVTDPTQVAWFDGTHHLIAPVTTTDQILTWVLGAGTGTIYRDGTSLGSAAYTVKDISITQAIGSNYAQSGAFLGAKIAAFLFYDVAHDDTQRNNVLSYLTPKYIIPPNTVTIDSPTAYQVFQRNSSNQANIAVEGTYTGSPTGIEARWNESAWVAMTAGGGIWNGTLNDQVGGQGTLEVRFTNDNTISASAAYVGVGDIFVIAGQSNAVGHLNNPQAYSHPTLKACRFGNDYEWGELLEPVDDNTGQIDLVSFNNAGPGAYWMLLATLYMADQNVPIAFVPCATDGIEILYWLPGVDHFDRTTLYGSMAYRAQQTGARAVLMHHGERDALVGNSQDTYYTRLNTVADSLYDDLGIKLMSCRLQQCTDRNVTAVNAAIAQAWADHNNVLAGADLSDMVLAEDPVHLRTDAEGQLAADRWWGAIESAFYAVPGTVEVTFNNRYTIVDLRDERYEITNEEIPI
jgi:hypothetical protein